MSRSASPAKSPKAVTRFGPVKKPEAVFGTEQRFQWQNSKYAADVAYDLPDVKMTRSVIFGNSLRAGADDENPDAKKNSTGPGSYDVAKGFDFNSEKSASRMTRFGAAPRQSMAMKTPSPGAVYNIDNCYWNGPKKNLAIGFNCDQRPPLYGSGAGSNAEISWPKLPTGPAITMGSRFKEKKLARPTPGAIYDVHERFNFKSGPSFSFGRGRGSRFQELGFLPELDD